MHPQVAIAVFVSPHGFGHAARASAIMNAIARRWPFVRFEIFTTIPEWFFQNSLRVTFGWHPLQADIGLFQVSSLCFDLDKTLTALDRFLPFKTTDLEYLAEKLHQLNCLLVVSDISPLGIAAAETAGLTSVLVENFTWDWIYEGFLEHAPRFGPYVDLFFDIYARVDHRIQADPVCRSMGDCLCVPPVCRPQVTERGIVRDRLGVSESHKMVLITMGGGGAALPFIHDFSRQHPKAWFVVPGQSAGLDPFGERQNNIIFLPPNSVFYHPDLVGAADVVVGKLGYSTLAEVYHAGVPFGFIPRPEFRESMIFESYVGQNMPGVKIDEAAFAGGLWHAQLETLLAMPRQPGKEPNGADAAAAYICQALSVEKELLEIVDSQGRVIGAAPRKSVHGNSSLLHRVVHVLVFDRNQRLLLQKRSRNKRVAPGRWDTSVGGHVDCGETIEAAMLREMMEELGIVSVAPRFAYHYIHANDFESELVFTYVCHFDGQITWNQAEIDTVKFWEFEEIKRALGKGVLSDNFEDEFRRYLDWSETSASIGALT